MRSCIAPPPPAFVDDSDVEDCPDTLVSGTPAPQAYRPRVFETGAMRDVDEAKFDYEGFLSPVVLERFAEYMHANRRMADGSFRTSDNWQKGIPLDAYMKSMWRHFMDLWTAHRGGRADKEEALCALLFNVQGYLHETLKAGR